MYLILLNFSVNGIAMNIKRKLYYKNELMLKDFIVRSTINRDLTDNTIKAYSGHIGNFINYFGKTFTDVSQSEIQEYIKLLRETRAENTASIALRCIRRFYNYLVITGAVTSNPAQGLHVRVNRYQRKPLAQLEINKVQQLILASKTDSESMLFAKVIYWTSMSVSEFCSLSIGDFFFRNNLPVLLIRKRNNTVEVPIPIRLGSEIQYFMTQRNLKRLSSKYLFSTVKGKKFQRGNLYKMIRILLQKVCSKEMGPRKLRNVFVTEILKNLNSESAIKKLLGLKSAGSLKGYISEHLERLLQVHRQFHPRA